MDNLLNNPKAIAELGEKIYRERYQGEFEKTNLGRFVAIDVKSGVAYLGDSPESTFEAAKKGSPDGIFHLVKVGSPGAFRLSYSLSWIANGNG